MGYSSYQSKLISNEIHYLIQKYFFILVLETTLWGIRKRKVVGTLKSTLGGRHRSLDMGVSNHSQAL